MDQLGKYKIVSELGRGGMGTVYKGYDTIIERDVAIKVIQERALSNSVARKRFYREARSAGRLSHENITIVHDVGEDDGRAYLVMEYLEGDDLRTLLDQGVSLSHKDKLSIAMQVCKGLYYAHQQGIVHRDIKPANIRVLPDGRVKVMDFGIARFQDETKGLTQTNMSLGTPRYMAPEQIKGETVDGRADIFSFGVMLYELFSGVNPFEADHFTAVMYKIINSEPKAIDLPTESVRRPLQAIIDTCLVKDPAHRYQDFRAVLNDLQAVPEEAGTTVPLAVVTGTATPSAAGMTQTQPIPARVAASSNFSDPTQLSPTPASVAAPAAAWSSSAMRKVASLGVGALVLAGLAVGGYFMFVQPRATPTAEQAAPVAILADGTTIAEQDAAAREDAAREEVAQETSSLPVLDTPASAAGERADASPQERAANPPATNLPAIEPAAEARPTSAQPADAPARPSPSEASSASRLATEEPPTILGIRPTGEVDDAADASPADAQVIARVETTVTMLTGDLKRFIEEENAQWMEAMFYRGWDPFFEDATDIAATVRSSNLRVTSTQRATVDVEVQLRYRDDYGDWKAEVRYYAWRLDFRNDDWMLTRVSSR